MGDFTPLSPEELATKLDALEWNPQPGIRDAASEDIAATVEALREELAAAKELAQHQAKEIDDYGSAALLRECRVLFDDVLVTFAGTPLGEDAFEMSMKVGEALSRVAAATEEAT